MLPAASAPALFWPQRLLRDGLAWLPIVALYVGAYHAQKSAAYNGHMLVVLAVALLPELVARPQKLPVRDEAPAPAGPSVEVQ